MNAPASSAEIQSLQAKQAILVDALRPFLGDDALLWQPEDTIPYECDGLAAYRKMPLAVALPENEEQVVNILKVCKALGVPVVPRGSGTGLSGGAMPIEQGLVLSLAKFKKILQVDPFTRTAVVQPGVRNLAISEAVAKHGLYYAPDPSSQIACSIGGNVNENSGGVHCLKYGLTLHNVLRVRAVLMNGDVVEFGSMAPDSPGLDLLAVLIGSEGMLGIVTEITVKLVPKPKLARVIMASFDDIEKGGNAVAAIIAAGIIPAGLEMMDKPTTRAVEEFVHAGYDLNAEAILLCESDGTPEEVEEEIARMNAVLEKQGASRIQVSESEAERLRFWSGRKNAFPAAGRIAADYYCMDGTIPRRHIATLLKRIKGMEAKYGLGCLNVFHAGDGNMHPLILFNGADLDEWHRAEEFGTEILEACVELGGTITGEHGVGIEKINSMCVQFGEQERERFWGVKAAFDPDRLLNPDKAIPTLNRCAEYGRMRVSGGVLPHPELERF
ncbi:MULTISPECIES: FAD-linked oxidase C-terminal domain-containing protein [unclassified Polynucleobacter]|uniref:FAD-linked oxidase C-terminal domain-containing protein n=1 Tax=unclassified Polynucleobacter TaxID=2640945 RepID=UPI0025727159|nr:MULTISPECIES: FAD-linked oxidase C-terminal domain-containing protein [unclassified Polynucleobacter]BEI35965.1 FAD-linked oxidase C-terminal domain-containing protein [Polynucleobacter sp. HIN6]BEI43301.1 FAD-linked oxidase C-terminal domain-containing protein [Polynucleobacter sp. HIN10]BEI45077.1 FAD-linked oxidase C-terminal domain-containing protein [Polynucleobacter sp. HIN11]